MQTWIDFIGATYYSKQGFIDEAKQYGVTRRVPLMQLGKMRFGDRVLVAIPEGKTPVVFGYFLIERLSGLSTSAVKALVKSFTTRLMSQGGRVVHRGCGSYIEGATLAIDATIDEIVAVLKKVADPGKLMIGGRFEDHEEIRLKSVKPGSETRTVRLFNYDGFLVAAHEAKQVQKSAGAVAVRGYFYAKAEDSDEGFVGPLAEIEAEVQEVLDYEKLDDKDAGEKQKNLKSGKSKGYRSKAKRDRAKAEAEAEAEQIDIEDLIEDEAAN